MSRLFSAKKNFSTKSSQYFDGGKCLWYLGSWFPENVTHHHYHCYNQVALTVPPYYWETNSSLHWISSGHKFLSFLDWQSTHSHIWKPDIPIFKARSNLKVKMNRAFHLYSRKGWINLIKHMQCHRRFSLINMANSKIKKFDLLRATFQLSFWFCLSPKHANLRNGGQEPRVFLSDSLGQLNFLILFLNSIFQLCQLNYFVLLLN